MLQDDFINVMQDYEEQIKSPDGKGIKADRQISLEDMLELDKMLSDGSIDPGDGFRKAADPEHPDYSHFDELPNMLKDYLAEKKLQQFAMETSGNFQLDYPIVQEKLKEYSTDPAFRRGIDLQIARGEDPAQMKACEDYMDQHMEEQMAKQAAQAESRKSTPQDDFIQVMQDYEEQIKSPDGKGIRADRQMSLDDMIELDTMLSDGSIDPGDGFWKAADPEHPDYSHFDELPNMLKDYLAEKKLQQFAMDTNGSFSTNNPAVQEKLKEYSSDPAFRRGVGLESVRGDNVEQMKACEEYMKEYETEKAKTNVKAGANAEAPANPQQELDSMIEQYAKDIKNPNGKGIKADRRLDAETMLKLNDLLLNPAVNPGEAFKKATNAEKPDFSKYGDIPGLLKDYLAEVKLQQFAMETKGSFDTKDPLVRENLEKYSMDPAFRTGISLGKQRKDVAADMKSCDAYMNMYVMEQTMKPVSEEQERNVNSVAHEKTNEVLRRNEDKQVFMAKMMFLSQLGRFDQNEADGVKKPYENTIAEAFGHGGRTGFILPPGKGQTKLFNNLFGENYSEKSGIEGRFAATHKVQQQTYNKDGSIAVPFKEEKSVGYVRNQYGMNIPVGGIGNIGPNQKPILDEGVDGHMYMNIVKGGEQKSGSLLVGVENEGPGKTGRLGHAHTAAAIKSDQSAFLSDKQGHGKEIGGRTVDLSHMDPNQLADMISDFEKGYRSMLQAAKTNKQAMNELLDVNRALCGQYMQPEAMANVMTNLGIKKKDAVSAVNSARSYGQGYYNDKAHEKAYEPISDRNVQNERIREEAPPVPKKPGMWNRLGAFLGIQKQKDLCKAYDDYQKSKVAAEVGPMTAEEKREFGSKRLDNMNGKEKTQEKVQEKAKNKGIRISKDDLETEKKARPQIKERVQPQRERSKSVYQKKSPYLNAPGKMK